MILIGDKGVDALSFLWLCAAGALSGATSSLRSSCRLRRGEPTSENNITFSPAPSFGCGSSPESATKEKRDAKAFFQGLLRRFAPRAAFGGANRHPRLAVRSPLSHRSDVVLPLKAQPKKKDGSSPESATKEKRDAKAFFQGLLRPFGARAIAAQWGEPTSENSDSFSPTLSFGCGSSPESATKEKRDAKMHLFFLGALSGTRTLGPLIKSQLLYQLS